MESGQQTVTIAVKQMYSGIVDKRQHSGTSEKESQQIRIDPDLQADQPEKARDLQRVLRGHPNQNIDATRHLSTRTTGQTEPIVRNPRGGPHRVNMGLDMMEQNDFLFNISNHSVT